MEVSTSLMRGLIAFLRSRQLDPSAILQALGNEDARSSEFGAPMLSLSTASRALEAARSTVRDPTFALRLGFEAPVQSLGLLGELLLHAPSLRACFGAVQSFAPLLLPVHGFSLHDQGQWVCFRFGFSAPLDSDFAQELVAALVVRFARHYLSRALRDCELRLAYPAPAHAELYAALFECKVVFGAARNELLLPRAHLQAAQPFPDELLWRALTKRAGEAMAYERARSNVHEQLRHVLRHRIDLHQVELRGAALALGISPRALRRRLNMEGYTYWSVLDEVRRELSIEELLHTRRPIKQIADRTGFSETSAFTRAFKRWTGVSPGEYRSSQGLQRAS